MSTRKRKGWAGSRNAADMSNYTWWEEPVVAAQYAPEEPIHNDGRSWYQWFHSRNLRGNKENIGTTSRGTIERRRLYGGSVLPRHMWAMQWVNLDPLLWTMQQYIWDSRSDFLVVREDWCGFYTLRYSHQTSTLLNISSNTGIYQRNIQERF
jgi:hypothetical protein